MFRPLSHFMHVGCALILFTGCSAIKNKGAVTPPASGISTATATASPVPTATATPVPTATPTPVPTATPTPVPTATPAFTCLSGYIKVPGNATYGTNDFCVMQYEAKDDGSGNAVSTAANVPWVNINRADAQAKCAAHGPTYDLISNPEWMTIATNAESQAGNWYGGVVGVNCLMRGNSGVTDNCTYAAGSVDYGASRDPKAMLVLSNGSQIWDLVGNESEWIDWSLSPGIQSSPTTCSESWTEFNTLSCSDLAPTDYMPLNPAGVTIYNSAYKIGMFDGGATGGAIRGGDSNLAIYASGNFAGLYTMLLNQNPSIGNAAVGFRCVYRP